MDGVINFLKPPGMTSHDVVAFLRRTYGQKRIGHTGTLDPVAAGVLPVCLGKATRLCDVLMAGEKTYVAKISFGTTTTSGDAQGEILTDHPQHIPFETLLAAMKSFIGEITQQPSAYSAIKIDGQRAYTLARQGKAVDMPSRRVSIYDWQILRHDETSFFSRIVCSKGTYIRSLAVDLGKVLGCGAYLSALIRTQSGQFGIAQAFTPEQIQQLSEKQRLQDAVISMDDALEHLPVTEVDASFMPWLLCGNAPPQKFVLKWSQGLCRLKCQDQLIALAEVSDDQIAIKAMLTEVKGGLI